MPKDFSLTRITGLFKAKTGKTLVSTLRAEDLAKLAKLVKAAQANDEELVVMVLHNAEFKPAYALFAGPPRERAEDTPARRPIRNAEPEPDPEDDENLPF